MDSIDINDIGNLENLSRFVLTVEEYKNLMQVNDGGEFTKNIN